MSKSCKVTLRNNWMTPYWNTSVAISESFTNTYQHLLSKVKARRNSNHTNPQWGSETFFTAFFTYICLYFVNQSHFWLNHFFAFLRIRDLNWLFQYHPTVLLKSRCFVIILLLWSRRFDWSVFIRAIVIDQKLHDLDVRFGIYHPCYFQWIFQK